MTPDRFAARHARFKELLKASPVGELASDHHHESMLKAMENAHRLLTSKERAAFDLANEPRKSYDRYNTGRFGLGCLLARRLAESGARFIEVTTEYVPFLHWDTHENGHATYARMKKEIDRPIAQLVLDLEERGMLDRTLVVLASEFSRDMMIEGVPGSTAKDQSRAKTDVLMEKIHYGLHRHFTGSGSVVMFGGGMKKGFLYGETAPERPLVVTKNPVSIRDLHATIFSAMGVSPKTAFDIEKRPFYATDDGKGVPVATLFAKS
jgi:arylsulfatase A-like enzyme